ncbi:fibrillarin [Candidatus Woesearchaeota archaeon]|nr:MAG: fibrillarin [Candidatus Woesearchaeota archaeon]
MIKEAGNRLAGIFVEESRKGKKFFTKNYVKGKTVYTESLVLSGGSEFRSWDPMKSKLAAALQKGLAQTYLRVDDKVLYLGASTGTTPSHVSDIVGKGGHVFALDFAPRVVRELVFMSENRDNISPIMGDANKPISYSHLVTGVDFVYMDIAQKNQSEIFIKNVDLFLKEGGFGMLFVKSKSIDISKRPKQIYSMVRKDLEDAGLTIVDFKELDPFEKDHCIFIVKKK